MDEVQYLPPALHTALTEDVEDNANVGKSSHFTSSLGQLEIGEQKLTLRILKMTDSVLLFICNADPEYLDEMAVAMPTVDGKALSSTLIGRDIVSDSQCLAEKLSKRFKRQIFVSYNVRTDRMTAPLLERHLSDYLRSHESEFI